MTDEGRKLKLYSVASPENWVEDFGSGQRSGGSAQIPLDPAFASTVNTGEAYHVFLTPNGDSKGLMSRAKQPAALKSGNRAAGHPILSTIASRPSAGVTRACQTEMEARRTGRELTVPFRPAIPASANEAAQPAKQVAP
jgi:hypothetical protein